MIIWIIGLSSSGKTVIGKRLHEYLMTSIEPWMFIDGDTFREIMGNDLTHSEEDRYKNGKRLSQFSKYLASQNVNAIVCVLSNHHDIQAQNKENISDYREIYIKADLEDLKKRDNKGIYKKALSGQIKNVVGVDIDFNPPINPDCVLNNTLTSNIDGLVRKAIYDLNLEESLRYVYTKNNLLDKKEKYEYSSYLPESFIELYIKERKDLLNRISFHQNKTDYSGIKSSAKKDNHWLIDKYKLNQKFSKLMLEEFNSLDEKINGAFSVKQWFLDSIQDINIVDNNVLFKLIQRYEVSKKVFTHYTNLEVKKASSSYHDFMNYVLFSLLLCELSGCSRYDLKQKAIFFNALLKINDTLISLDGLMFSPSELLLLEMVIKKELQIFKKFGSQHL